MIRQVQNNNGFSLMELMIAMAIFSVVIAGIVSSNLQQSDQHVTQIQVVEMQQSGRAAMFLLKRKIRMAGFNPYTDGTFDTGNGITTADASQLIFNYVETSDYSVETIGYNLTDNDGDGDTDITITQGGTTNILAENIDALTFTYYNSAGSVLSTPVSNPENIRRLDITITAAPDSGELDRETGSGGGETNSRTLTSTICLRNMGL